MYKNVVGTSQGATKISQLKVSPFIMRIRNTQTHSVGRIQNFGMLKQLVNVVTTCFERFNYDVPSIRTNLISVRLNTRLAIKE
jgi:hypothetical protein